MLLFRYVSGHNSTCGKEKSYVEILAKEKRHFMADGIRSTYHSFPASEPLLSGYCHPDAVVGNLNPGPHKFRRFAEGCARLGAKKVDLKKSFAAAKSLLRID